MTVPYETGLDSGKILAVDSVSVELSGRPVLDDVSFGIGPGEFIGLIGPNGAGKTTLLRTVLGLQRPVAGRVHVRGRSRRNRAIGYVPQKVVLDPDVPMRARDLVELGIDGHRLGLPVPSRVRRQLVDEMLLAVEAERFADARAGRLSGGELQRILVAHALVSRPDLLLLDEPLANLDPGSGQSIVELLHRITSEQHVAVLLAAHEMNPLLPVMDGIVYLAGGHAASGTIEQVVRSDVLSSLYGHHVDVLEVHGRVLVVTSPIDAGNGTASPSSVVATG
jgi:zinc/manganese transport system ATP-binding protein